MNIDRKENFGLAQIVYKYKYKESNMLQIIKTEGIVCKFPSFSFIGNRKERRVA